MTNNEFPKDFLFGGAIAACQAEGAFDMDGRGLSSSDLHRYNPETNTSQIKYECGGTKSQVLERLNDKNGYFPKRYGIDFYHTYKADLALLAELGLKAFRTSISWSRIFPRGDEETPNEKGLEFYDNVIDEIIAQGMVPIMTMEHYDFPMTLITEYGGFANKKVIDFFVKYAKILLERYGDKVPYWIIFNQINLVPTVNFGSLGLMDNQAENMEELMYQAVHNQFIAQAKVKALASEMKLNTKIGTMVSDNTRYPASCKPQDVIWTMKKNRMQYFFTDVQFNGSYPEYALNYFKENNITVEISEADKQLLANNKMEFLGISYYATYTIDYEKNTMAINDYEQNPYLKPTPWNWRVDPLGFYNSLSQYWDRYQVPMVIAENGYGAIDEVIDGQIKDGYRVEYYRRHLKVVKQCLDEGVAILSFLAWAPIDLVSSSSAEMSKRYGFIYIDIDNFGKGTHKRLKKDSFDWFQKVIHTHGASLYEERDNLLLVLDK
ncbi:TPA_asm: beta-glucosidase [Listeria monocytogenes]|nr:beta-glucosidase [Listeria monocytogenes]